MRAPTLWNTEFYLIYGKDRKSSEYVVSRPEFIGLAHRDNDYTILEQW